MPSGLPPRTGNFVTSAEVAFKAGVSRSAVSRAFTPGARIAPKTRAYIVSIAKQLGYRVNRVAQSLNSARSHAVGLIGSNLDTPFHARQVALLSAALGERGMECLLLNAREPKQVGPAIERLLESRVRAVVILSGTPPTSLVDECLFNGLRVILINRRRQNAADAITTDDEAGTSLAFQALCEAGCQRIGLVGSDSATSSITRRMAIFLRLAHKAGIEVHTWAQGPTAYESGILAAAPLLAAGIDGAFCVTDLLALGFLDSARHDHGISIPDQLCVIGFDDIPQAAWQSYRLTTIRQPLDLMAEAMLRLLDRPSATQIERIMLPVSLIRRDTLRPLRPTNRKKSHA